MWKKKKKKVQRQKNEQCHNVGQSDKVSGWITNSWSDHFLPGTADCCWAWRLSHRIELADGGGCGLEADMAAQRARPRGWLWPAAVHAMRVKPIKLVIFEAKSGAVVFLLHSASEHKNKNSADEIWMAPDRHHSLQQHESTVTALGRRAPRRSRAVANGFLESDPEECGEQRRKWAEQLWAGCLGSVILQLEDTD